MDDTTARDDSFIAFEDQDIDDKIDNNTTGKKVWRFFKKFFLAVIAIGLVAALVFQILIIGSREECEVRAVDPALGKVFSNDDVIPSVQGSNGVAWTGGNYSGDCAEGDTACLQI